MRRQTPHPGLTAGSVALLVVGLVAELRASLYGAGGDTPIVQPALLKVQLWFGVFGLVVLAVLINAIATGRWRSARLVAVLAALIWGAWVALGVAGTSGGWP
jgi:hypothetical protein